MISLTNLYDEYIGRLKLIGQKNPVEYIVSPPLKWVECFTEQLDFQKNVNLKYNSLRTKLFKLKLTISYLFYQTKVITGFSIELFKSLFV